MPLTAGQLRWLDNFIYRLLGMTMLAAPVPVMTLGMRLVLMGSLVVWVGCELAEPVVVSLFFHGPGRGWLARCRSACPAPRASPLGPLGSGLGGKEPPPVLRRGGWLSWGSEGTPGDPSSDAQASHLPRLLLGFSFLSLCILEKASAMTDIKRLAGSLRKPHWQPGSRVWTAEASTTQIVARLGAVNANLSSENMPHRNVNNCNSSATSSPHLGRKRGLSETTIGKRTLNQPPLASIARGDHRDDALGTRATSSRSKFCPSCRGLSEPV